jgi:hypothetical protein
MPAPLQGLRRWATAALAAGLLAAATGAAAASHALILWIGDYGSADLNLPGLEVDARNAREIARLMGVPPQNVREVSNRTLTRQRIAAELAELDRRVAPGDRVFVYYSGHGHQFAGQGGARCTEALVVQGPDFYADGDFQDALTRLGRKASQVVVMNDSCFSGGAATRSLAAAAAAPGWVAKFYPASVGVATAIAPGYQCGEAVNKMLRSLAVVEKASDSAQVLYVAASSDAEVAFATPNGSVATNAWLQCLADPRADVNRSGSINGRELQACAQRVIDAARGARQTITLQGNADLPLSFVASTAGGATQQVDPAQALRDLQAGAARDRRVRLDVSTNRLRIREDFLDFTVSTDRDGYLYVLQVGSDGRTFNLLYPNAFDRDNLVRAGTHRLPRQNWRVRAGGPAGTSHIMAIVAPEPRDFLRGAAAGAAFSSVPVSSAATRTLFVEASGAAGGSGSYGASAVIAIEETP